MYLKKKKMYALAVDLLHSKELVSDPVPSMRESEYKFFRGSEWLTLFFGDVEFKLYHGNGYISIELVDFDSEKLLYRKMLSKNEYELIVGV